MLRHLQLQLLQGGSPLRLLSVRRRSVCAAQEPQPPLLLLLCMLLTVLLMALVLLLLMEAQGAGCSGRRQVYEGLARLLLAPPLMLSTAA